MLHGAVIPYPALPLPPADVYFAHQFGGVAGTSDVSPEYRTGIPHCGKGNFIMSSEIVLPKNISNIIDEMKNALRYNIDYAAILIALTIPEICMALTISKNTNVGKKLYLKFIDDYCDYRLGIDGETCYNLRCGLVHRGNASSHVNFPYDNVIFLPSSSKNTIVGGMKMHIEELSALQLSTKNFCEQMESGVLRWCVDFGQQQTVLAADKELLSPRENGVAPFVGGVPLIASGLDDGSNQFHLVLTEVSKSD